MTLTVGSLFSGIGGLELGLERAGMKTVWQVERDPYAQKVLAKHWPNVKRCADVREVHVAPPREYPCDDCLPPVDLVCGGFPCQDISNAGKRAGIDGERSGLWAEFHRLVCELRPRFVLVENVAALLVRGLDRVLGDLAASGYDAEWDCIPAAALGAHHERDRLFVVAWDASDPVREPIRFWTKRGQWRGWRVRAAIGSNAEPLEYGGVDGWTARPALSRMDDGAPEELERERVLGNAVVPQVAEFIGRRILEVAR